MKSLFRRNKGIGLVEILITMGVLAVGILGVAGLNSVISRQSHDNKAQSEALAIAQSRIEAVRNYTNDVDTLAEFDTLYASTQGFQNVTAVNGVNAAFTRSERITDSDDNKIVDVIVTWTDSNGNAQNVTLNTELSYISPRSIGDTALVAAQDIVNAPTGRARLGEGTLDGDEILQSDPLDGTKSYKDGDDLKLAVGNQIVLTLALACQTDDGICIDFVKIKGRVYIDTDSTNREPHEVSLIASDAAYCARYYTIDNTVYPFTATTSKTDTPHTTNEEYEYFDYTCYIGGGWHGNVGIVLAGGIDQRDKVCIGDPVTTYTPDLPVIAVRRAYRGMIYKPSELTTVNNVVQLPWKFYSQGIADGVSLPYQNGHGHDFVVGEMAPANNAGTDCYSSDSLMTRTDAEISGVEGALFQDMPNGFVCLNEFPNYLDTYSNEYANNNTCPFDPTNPPSTRFVISGSIAFTGIQDSANDALTSSINLITSDGEGNCLVTPFTYGATSYGATYLCDVYDWSNDLTTGWTGYIKPTYSTGMTCTPNPLNMTDITANDSTGNDFTCSTGGPATWTGTVTQVGNGPSADKKIGSITVTGTGASAGVNGSCVIAGNGFSYTCSTDSFLGTWSGNLVFTSGGTGGAICPYVAAAATTKTYSLTGISSGDQTPINLRIGRGSNGNGCP